MPGLMNTQMKNLSANIKMLGAELGLAQEKLAFEAGIDRTLISKIERGLANPTLNVLVRISSFLNVSVCELLCDPEERNLN